MANETSAVPTIPKEIGKKKRANRSAKLKQCKLDARREQWLSQVKSKEYRDTTMTTSPPQRISEGRSTEKVRQYQVVATSPEHDGSSLLDSSDADSLTHSPIHQPNGNPSRNGSPTNNSISSSGSSIGSFSRTVTDDEDDKEDAEEGGVLDDWEAIADALSMSPPKSTEIVRIPETIKQEPQRTTPRAWRADDTFRPQSLPNLSKQRSFPINMERKRHYGAHLNHRGILSPPPQSSCPICYEDLDLTDSSFLPCSCGFRLCLFCHKRILEADGRCPGCRKQYSPMAGCETADIITEAWVPPLPYRFSRSYSMSPRS